MTRNLINIIRHELASWVNPIVAMVALTLSAPVHAQSMIPAGAELDAKTWATLEEEAREEVATMGREPFVIYRAGYVNLVLTGLRDGAADSPVALVAGHHDPHFPYSGTLPWDNMLLKVGDEHLYFTQMNPAGALDISMDAREESPTAVRIRFTGEMVSAATGEKVPVELDIPASLSGHRLRRLGKPHRWLRSLVASWTSPDLIGHDILPGLRWKPFSLTATGGTLRIRNQVVSMTDVHGELEKGLLTNINARTFAISYDYVAVAAPGAGGYSFVDFTSHSLHPNTATGRLLDWYARTTGSEGLTLAPDRELPPGEHGVKRPASHDDGVLLFETRVDLGLASLRRQMIRTTDATGRPLFGLREIFEAVRD